MLLYKFYINLAIVVIFKLFSSLFDLSMKIFPIRWPPCILRNENVLLAQILKNKLLKVSVVSKYTWVLTQRLFSAIFQFMTIP